MKLLRALFVCAILLWLVACVPAPVVPTPTPTAAPLPTATISPRLEFDASRALEHNRMLAVTIGARVAGSENATRASDYVAQQFSAYGYGVELQRFMFEGWEDLGTRVQITAPEARGLATRPIQFSPSGNVEVELVAVGGVGDASDFAKVNIKERVALVERGTLAFSDKAQNAAKAGAVAVIVYNNAPGAFGGTLRDRVTIPVLGVSGRDGQMLRDLLAKGAVRVKIASETRIEQKTGRNVIATRRGSGDSIIVLGAHYDSVAEGTGAVDNGSCTAVLLEVARVLVSKERKHTLVFIAFDAEELGLLGSRHYVERLADGTRAKIVAMLNFDMLGGGSRPLLAGGDGSVGKMARDAAKELSIEARNFSLGSTSGSDHQSFQRIGIDTVMFSRGYDLLHTPQDTIDQVRVEFLAETGCVAVRVVEEAEGK